MPRYVDTDKLLENIRHRLGIKSLDWLTAQEKVIVDEIQLAPAVDAIPREIISKAIVTNCPLHSIDEMIAEIEELKPTNPNFRHYEGETRAINNVLDIIHKYCDIGAEQ